VAEQIALDQDLGDRSRLVVVEPGGAKQLGGKRDQPRSSVRPGPPAAARSRS
jgi:hypothetical protein